jgi:hypothetical protein
MILLKVVHLLKTYQRIKINDPMLTGKTFLSTQEFELLPFWSGGRYGIINMASRSSSMTCLPAEFHKDLLTGSKQLGGTQTDRQTMVIS